MWEPRGTESQRALAVHAIARVQGFPWQWLAEGLRIDTGRRSIPIEWADLSRWGQEPAAASQPANWDKGYPPPEAPAEATHHREGEHHHVHEGADKAHVVEHRSRVLGLAWYSGKVQVEQSLKSDPELATEVLLAEGAHMVDFFYMSPRQRALVYAAFHGGVIGPHADHGWFDERGNATYWSFVGEAFMAGFTAAFAPTVPITLTSFDHAIDAEVARLIREALLDPSYFGLPESRVFHDDHRCVRSALALTWRTYEEALAVGREPCRTCKPRPERGGMEKV